MVIALTAILGSVALGTAIAFARGSDRVLLAVRRFAYVAAGAVVCLQLVPEAWQEVGAWALLATAVAFGVPVLLERMLERWSRPAGSMVGLEAAYAALCVHQVADGFAVGSVTEHLVDVAVALVVHTVPVVAVFMIEFRRQRGGPRTILRAVGLGIGTTVGVALARWVGAGALSALDPWITAVVAGLLLHVLAHDWPWHRHRPGQA